ncbi:GAP family protein [Mycolicibacterium thermoresistibile]
MWGDVLGLALFVSLNPMLLALILLMISRPRPIPNLLAFWIGCLIVNVPIWLVPLMALHLVPSFESFARDLATPSATSGIQPLQFGTGVFCLLVAAWITVRLLRRRVAEPVAVAAGGNASTLVLDADDSAGAAVDTATDEAPPRGRVRRGYAAIRAAIGRLVSRVKEAWENGAVWVSLVFGLAYVPPPPLILLVNTIIVASGAPIGTQVVAVLVFIVMMLAVFEIALLSYVFAPRRTETVLQPIHDWARDHRMQVLLALFAIVGTWQVVTGAGII